MLGELIGEDKGKITGAGVLPSEGAGPHMEVSFQADGKLLGQDINELDENGNTVGKLWEWK